MVPGHYYAYTLPGDCGVIYLDGRLWVTTLSLDRAVPDLYVWFAIHSAGWAGWIGPGAVGYKPETETPPTCAPQARH